MVNTPPHLLFPSISCSLLQIRQGSAKQVVSSLQQKQKKDVSYQTKVVAGVVHRTPIQVCVCVWPTAASSTRGGPCSRLVGAKKGVIRVCW